MNQYLKVAVISLMIMLLSGIALIARAADPELLIEFQGVENATEYQLFVELDLVTGTLNKMNQYLKMALIMFIVMLLSGVAFMVRSAYPFKLRGQGTIINIRRIK